MAATEPPIRSARLMQSTPVLKCSDYIKSRVFYVGRLGFQVVEEGGDPPRFGILQREGASLFLDAWHGGPSPDEKVWDAYIHVRDIEALEAEFTAAGVVFSKALNTTGYGMREFEVSDPDGNVICFGEDDAASRQAARSTQTGT